MASFILTPFKISKQQISRTALTILLLMGICITSFAQEIMPYTQAPPDTSSRSFLRRQARENARLLEQQHPVKKNTSRAWIELIGMEVGVYSFNHWVRHTDFTRIDWGTTKRNINPGNWWWDKDEFQTNQFGHPYHGALFYNSFRSNGYSFWQSAPAAVLGSYAWETFAENEPPSIGDFVNTSFGGIVLGEMTYRLSSKIVNNNTHGFKRQLSEVAGLLINPMGGLNRILDGKWGKYTYNKADRDSSKITAEFDLGIRKFSVGSVNPLKDGGFGWYGRARLLYGTPYLDYRKPFSNMNISLELGKDDSTLVNTLSVYGSIAGWPIRSKGKFQHLAILSANYDYIRNYSFFYGGQSVQINLYSKMEVHDKVKLNTTLSTGAILLSAIPSAHPITGRSYDYGTGLAFSAMGGITVLDRFKYSLGYRGALTTTLNGSPSNYFLHALTNEASYRFADNVSLAAESGYFVLSRNYRALSDDTKRYPYLRFSVRYTLNP